MAPNDDRPDYKIVVAQPIDDDITKALSEFGPVFVNPGPEPLRPDELRRLCQSASGLMAFMTERIDRDLLAACPDLRIVAGALKGFDNVDLAACDEHDVRFTYVPDLLTQPTAELALGLMIACARNLLAGDAQIRSGRFQGWRPSLYGDSIFGARVGVVGAGAVGQAIMQLLTGFDCRCCYVDTTPLSGTRETQLKAEHLSFDALIETSDFVVLAVPLTPQTVGMINAEVLGRMKPGAYLINPARGSVVVERDVLTALESGHLGGYGADVFELEDRSRADAPATIEEGLLRAPQTVFTPHLGSAVTSVRRAITQAAAAEIMAALR